MTETQPEQCLDLGDYTSFGDNGEVVRPRSVCLRPDDHNKSDLVDHGYEDWKPSEVSLTVHWHGDGPCTRSNCPRSGIDWPEPSPPTYGIKWPDDHATRNSPKVPRQRPSAELAADRLLETTVKQPLLADPTVPLFGAGPGVLSPVDAAVALTSRALQENMMSMSDLTDRAVARANTEAPRAAAKSEDLSRHNQLTYLIATMVPEHCYVQDMGSTITWQWTTPSGLFNITLCRMKFTQQPKLTFTVTHQPRQARSVMVDVTWTLPEDYDVQDTLQALLIDLGGL